MNNRQLYKEIRNICNDNGWDIFSTYSDKRSFGRRVKFMRNGWEVPNDMKCNIMEKVTKLLEDNNIDGIGYWNVGFAWRGQYDYFAIKLVE